MPQVEKEWTTKVGLRAVCLIANGSHRCGYVAVPPGYMLHGVEYSEDSKALREAWEKVKQGGIGKRGLIPLLCNSDRDSASPDVVFDVHGGLTYSGDGQSGYPVNGETWWFGFDCAHSGDGYIEGSSMAEIGISDGPVRSMEYVEAECESLAAQIAEIG